MATKDETKIKARRHTRKSQILSKHIEKIEWRDRLKRVPNLFIVVVELSEEFCKTETAFVKFWLDVHPNHVPGPKIIRTDVIKGMPENSFMDRIAISVTSLITKNLYVMILPSYFKNIAIQVKNTQTVMVLKRNE